MPTVASSSWANCPRWKGRSGIREGRVSESTPRYSPILSPRSLVSCPRCTPRLTAGAYLPSHCTGRGATGASNTQFSLTTQTPSSPCTRRRSAFTVSAGPRLASTPSCPRSVGCTTMSTAAPSSSITRCQARATRTLRTHRTPARADHRAIFLRGARPRPAERGTARRAAVRARARTRDRLAHAAAAP